MWGHGCVAVTELLSLSLSASLSLSRLTHPSQVYEEGLNFRLPLLQEQRLFSIRTRAHTISSKMNTKNQQQVNMTLRE